MLLKKRVNLKRLRNIWRTNLKAIRTEVTFTNLIVPWSIITHRTNAFNDTVQ